MTVVYWIAAICAGLISSNYLEKTKSLGKILLVGFAIGFGIIAVFASIPELVSLIVDKELAHSPAIALQGIAEDGIAGGAVSAFVAMFATRLGQKKKQQQ